MATSIWREAVDPASGRTYYYHLITRETTWDKPPQPSDETEGVTLNVASTNLANDDTGRQVDSLKANGAGEEGEEERDLDEEEQKADAAVARLLQTFVNIREKFGAEFVNVICAVNGLQQFKVLLSGALGVEAQGRCLSLLIGGFDDSASALALCNAHVPPSLLHAALSPDVSSLGRLQALHVLCRLCCHAASHPSLKAQLDWLKLARAEGGVASAAHTREWDLRVCVSVCVLVCGPCGGEVDEGVLATWRERVQRLLLQSTGNDAGSGSVSDDLGGVRLLPLPIGGRDVCTLDGWLRGAARGRGETAALPLLAHYLATLTTDFDECERLIGRGGVGLLQALCLDACPHTQAIAQQSLLDLLQKHQSVGVQVLSSWVGLAGDLPKGLYRCSASQVLACRPTDDDGLMLLGPHEEGQGVDLGVADAFLKVGRVRVAVHKAIIMGRASLLRDLLLQQPDDVIFSLDGLVPENLLSTLLTYLYTGIPIIPGETPELLELLQCAWRLRLNPLVADCEKVLHGHVGLGTVKPILQVADACALPSLQASCRSFLHMSSLPPHPLPTPDQPADSPREHTHGQPQSCPSLSPPLALRPPPSAAWGEKGSGGEGEGEGLVVMEEVRSLVTSMAHRKGKKPPPSAASIGHQGQHPPHGSIYRALLQHAHTTAPAHKANTPGSSRRVDSPRKRPSDVTRDAGGRGDTKATDGYALPQPPTQPSKTASKTAGPQPTPRPQKEAPCRAKTNKTKAKTQEEEEEAPYRTKIKTNKTKTEEEEGGGPEPRAKATEFIETLHSLRPPPPATLDDRRSRAELRALPKRPRGSLPPSPPHPTPKLKPKAGTQTQTQAPAARGTEKKAAASRQEEEGGDENAGPGKQDSGQTAGGSKRGEAGHATSPGSRARRPQKGRDQGKAESKGGGGGGGGTIPSQGLVVKRGQGPTRRGEEGGEGADIEERVPEIKKGGMADIKEKLRLLKARARLSSTNPAVFLGHTEMQMQMCHVSLSHSVDLGELCRRDKRHDGDATPAAAVGATRTWAPPDADGPSDVTADDDVAGDAMERSLVLDSVREGEEEGEAEQEAAADKRAATEAESPACLRRSGCQCASCHNVAASPSVTTPSVTSPSVTSDSVGPSSPPPPPGHKKRAQRPAPRMAMQRHHTTKDTANSTPPVAKGKWRQDSEALRCMLRSARQGPPTPTGPRSSEPSPSDPSLVACPHCDRRFNPQAAERHVARCMHITIKPARLAKGQGRTAASRVSVSIGQRREAEATGWRS